MISFHPIEQIVPSCLRDAAKPSVRCSIGALALDLPCDALPAGHHVLRLVLNGDYNFGKLEFRRLK